MPLGLRRPVAKRRLLPVCAIDLPDRGAAFFARPCRSRRRCCSSRPSRRACVPSRLAMSSWSSGGSAARRAGRRHLGAGRVDARVRPACRGSARSRRRWRHRGRCRPAPCRTASTGLRGTRVRVSATPSPSASRSSVMRFALGTPAPAFFIISFMTQPLMPPPASSGSAARFGLGDQHVAVGQHMEPARVIEAASRRRRPAGPARPSASRRPASPWPARCARWASASAWAAAASGSGRRRRFRAGARFRRTRPARSLRRRATSSIGCSWRVPYCTVRLSVW